MPSRLGPRHCGQSVASSGARLRRRLRNDTANQEQVLAEGFMKCVGVEGFNQPGPRPQERNPTGIVDAFVALRRRLWNNSCPLTSPRRPIANALVPERRFSPSSRRSRKQNDWGGEQEATESCENTRAPLSPLTPVHPHFHCVCQGGGDPGTGHSLMIPPTGHSSGLTEAA